jgi:predicted RNA binding protein YcfA (HicA-like mRNA interferase family)
MAPRLRRLTARELLAELGALGFQVVSVRGSHAKMRREGARGDSQILTVPLHRELAAGTLRAIYRQAARFVPEEELRSRFFSD